MIVFVADNTGHTTHVAGISHTPTISSQLSPPTALLRQRHDRQDRQTDRQTYTPQEMEAEAESIVQSRAWCIACAVLYTRTSYTYKNKTYQNEGHISQKLLSYSLK